MPADKGFLNFQDLNRFKTQPEVLEITRKKAELTIGVPREIAFQENRVGLVPEAVAMLVNNGIRVVIESNAGKSAHFPDDEFIEAGAHLVYSAAEVYQSDVVIKVAPPIPSEIEKFRNRLTVISALHLAGQNDVYFRRLIAKKTTAISYEHIRDKTSSIPVMRSLSEIAGNESVFIGAKYLSDPEYGRGKGFGGFSGITPVEVVVAGAGTVGEYAARAALGLGAVVKVFDDNIYKLSNLQGRLNTRIFTSIIQPKVLAKALSTADVVIGALHAPNGITPCVITEDMVRQMPYGSVIVDVSIVNGGCCETSRPTNHSQPVFKKHGVTHYCVPNISSCVPHTASYALSNVFAPILLNMCEEGGVENLLKTDQGVRQGTYLYNGILTNRYISDIFSIPFQDIELLMFPLH